MQKMGKVCKTETIQNLTHRNPYFSVMIGRLVLLTFHQRGCSLKLLELHCDTRLEFPLFTNQKTFPNSKLSLHLKI